MSVAPGGPVTSLRVRDGLVTGGALLSSLAITWLLWFRLTSFSGKVGFVLSWAVLFLGIYWLVVRETEGRLAATDRLAGMTIGVIALCLLIPLILIIGFVLVRGIKALTPAFFTQSLEGVGPLDPPEKGGALHAIIGTLEQITIATLISVPLGFATAVFLNEVGGVLRRPVRIFVNAMSGVPSIVAGLFIYGVLIIQFGQRFSGFAAALALAILMLPTVTRTAEEVLRLVPGGLREAALALGAQEWSTTWRVVLPTARAGLVTAGILGVARSVGETAPLLSTAFGNNVTNLNPFSGPQSALPLFSYSLLGSPIEGDVNRAWTGALVLITLVLGLFIAARVISRRAGNKTGRANKRRVAKAEGR
ncbi:MAG: phosphate ABC transporter permease PstA [Actinomycetota bacterium]